MHFTANLASVLSFFNPLQTCQAPLGLFLYAKSISVASVEWLGARPGCNVCDYRSGYDPFTDPASDIDMWEQQLAGS